MNSRDLKEKLQYVIESKLSPLIDNDYVYWDLPYHINIGDTLIWQGTLDFLSKKEYKMLDYGSFSTANLKKLKDKKTIILLHGGGNLGDIYSSHQNFRKKIITKYRDNKIIILPQTIHFKDKRKEREDLTLFASHRDLYVCVRDHASYKLACEYMAKDKVLLLPDMAFCMKPEIFPKQISTGKKLLMSRIDVEAIEVDGDIRNKVDIKSDWPTFENSPIYYNFLRLLMAVNRKVFGDNRQTFLIKCINYYAMFYVRKKLLSTGIEFINQFDLIYTTRLHGCILSLLLNKKIFLLDNSYGKNRAYYDAWLIDSNNIEISKF